MRSRPTLISRSRAMKKSHVVTVASGPRAEALEQVALPSNSRLHKPKPVAVQGWAIVRQVLAIVRCQSKSGRWTSWQEAGAEQDRLRLSVIKSQVHRQKHEHLEYVLKHFTCYISGVWCPYSCSAVGMHEKNTQKFSGSDMVCTFFEPRSA